MGGAYIHCSRPAYLSQPRSPECGFPRNRAPESPTFWRRPLQGCRDDVSLREIAWASKAASITTRLSRWAIQLWARRVRRRGFAAPHSFVSDSKTSGDSYRTMFLPSGIGPISPRKTGMPRSAKSVLQSSVPICMCIFKSGSHVRIVADQQRSVAAASDNTKGVFFCHGCSREEASLEGGRRTRRVHRKSQSYRKRAERQRKPKALAEKGDNPHSAGVSGLVYVDARTLAGIPDGEGGIHSMEVVGVLVEYL